MQTPEIITLVAAIAALVVGGLAYYRSGKPLTLQGVTETLTDAQSLAAELREVAEIGVLAAQQLKEKGDIKTNEEAFQHAFKHVQRWYERFGGVSILDAETIANFVEGVYYGVKAVNGSGAKPPPTDDLDMLNEWQREQRGAGGYEPEIPR